MADYDDVLAGGDPKQLLTKIMSQYIGNPVDPAERLSTLFKKIGPTTGESSSTGNTMKSEVNWPRRFDDAAAKYCGPWEEAKNLDDFMSCQPNLRPCETTHIHPVSVSILSFPFIVQVIMKRE